MGDDFSTTCAAGNRCKRPAKGGGPGRVKKAPNRLVGTDYFHTECVPEGRRVSNENDQRVPGYGEQRKYTRRTWER